MLYFLMGENIHFNDYGRIYNSIFHSVAAFNGSGFDIINDANGGSIGSITGDSYFLIITMVLIFFGSIGYPIVFELLRNTKMAYLSKFKEIHLSLNSKNCNYCNFSNSNFLDLHNFCLVNGIILTQFMEVHLIAK